MNASGCTTFLASNVRVVVGRLLGGRCRTFIGYLFLAIMLGTSNMNIESATLAFNCSNDSWKSSAGACEPCSVPENDYQEIACPCEDFRDAVVVCKSGYDGAMCAARADGIAECSRRDVSRKNLTVLTTAVTVETSAMIVETTAAGSSSNGHATDKGSMIGSPSGTNSSRQADVARPLDDGFGRGAILGPMAGIAAACFFQVVLAAVIGIYPRCTPKVKRKLDDDFDNSTVSSSRVTLEQSKSTSSYSASSTEPRALLPSVSGARDADGSSEASSTSVYAFTEVASGPSALPPASSHEDLAAPEVDGLLKVSSTSTGRIMDTSRLLHSAVEQFSPEEVAG